MKGILALGNALTDIVCSVTDEELQKLGMRKGCRHLPGELDMEEVLRTIKNPVMIPGGAPANVAAGAAYLGAKAGLIATVGSDEMGEEYVRGIKSCGVESHVRSTEGRSGACYILATPDGERTSIAAMGVAAQYKISKELIRRYSIFHTSAYELTSNPEPVLEAMKYAKKLGRTVSFDLADRRLIESEFALIINALQYVNIVFANEEEAKAFTGFKPKEAAETLAGCCGIAAVKMGEQGSIVKQVCGETYRIAAFPANVVNTNGAGDAYAAGFLTGYARGKGLEECGKLGSWLAARVCERKGARLDYALPANFPFL